MTRSSASWLHRIPHVPDSLRLACLSSASPRASVRFGEHLLRGQTQCRKSSRYQESKSCRRERLAAHASAWPSWTDRSIEPTLASKDPISSLWKPTGRMPNALRATIFARNPRKQRHLWAARHCRAGNCPAVPRSEYRRGHRRRQRRLSAQFDARINLALDAGANIIHISPCLATRSGAADDLVERPFAPRLIATSW